MQKGGYYCRKFYSVIFFSCAVSYVVRDLFLSACLEEAFPSIVHMNFNAIN